MKSRKNNYRHGQEKQHQEKNKTKSTLKLTSGKGCFTGHGRILLFFSTGNQVIIAFILTALSGKYIAHSTVSGKISFYPQSFAS